MEMETVINRKLPGKPEEFVEDANNNPVENAPPPPKKKLEVLYDGHYYDVTEFFKRHPGGEIMQLYLDGDDATIAMNQFHYRSLKTMKAYLKGLKKRPALEEEDGLDPVTRKRHEELDKGFAELHAELEAKGFFEPSPFLYFSRMIQSLVLFSCGLFLLYFGAPHSFLLHIASQVLMALGAGQYLWLGHEGGHNSFTGWPKIDRLVQIWSYGFVFGLSANCWNFTHVEHHAMPQHETKDADLKTMPLLAFNEKLVRNPKHSSKFWLHYQHLLFVLCDTFIVTLTWKFNHHIKYAYKHGHWLDLFFMATHYSLVFVLGFVDWMVLTWLVSIYILGNLILSHTHLPLVKEGQKMHWVEYAFIYTSNVRSSWWVDWWMGFLNYQIEHHLFPTMPEYKGKLMRDHIKEFAKKYDLPYQLCSYWEAVKRAYCNLEHVAHEIKTM